MNQNQNIISSKSLPIYFLYFIHTMLILTYSYSKNGSWCSKKFTSILPISHANKQNNIIDFDRIFKQGY